jgi:3-hydroxybutyryl-CoA dehydratase
LKVGDIISWQRSFSANDIKKFGELSGDKGVQHIATDEQGRIMAQGLLTATLPTKIGGDLNFIAHKMSFEFARPVYAGDTINCEVTLLRLIKKGEFVELSCKWTCRNQLDKEVLTGEAEGIIKKYSST